MTDHTATGAAPEPPELPLPRWVITTIWRAHRMLFRTTGGRAVLSTPVRGKHFGVMRVHTLGRRSGKPRTVILGYIHDGPNLATIAMNGWDEAEPAWWLNLRGHPDAVVDLPGERRTVRARTAEGDERERLWREMEAHKGWGDDLDALAMRRPAGTSVVVLEPR